LRFLNHQLGSPLTLSEVVTLGAEIGADVPFFVLGTPAVVKGIGEIVEPIADIPPKLDLVLCSPDEALPTARVYAEADRSLTTQRLESNIASFVVRRKPVEQWLGNDLEAAAARICPEVRTLKRRLLDLGALGASMTGSGSAVFGICRDESSARRIAETLRREGRWSCATRTLTRSPGVED
jgi:4-diphosphocytidyl-2-C-methyl-D-erythritol kinase